MSDVYDTLSPSAQLAVRTKLLADVQGNPCPSVDISSVKTVDSLNDASTRAIAVDCFQTSHTIQGASPGILDQKTYSALVGWWAAIPLWQKLAGGAGVAGLAWYALHHHKKKRRR